MPSRSTRRGTPDYDLLRLALLEQEQNTQPGRTPSALSMNAYLGGMPETYEQGRESDMLGEMDRRYYQSREDDRKRRGLVDDAKAQATVRGFQTRTGVEEGESAYPSDTPATGVRTIRRFGSNATPVDPDAAMGAEERARLDPRVLAAGETAKGTAARRGAITPGQQFAMTTRLQRDYDTVRKPAVEMDRQLRLMRSGLNQAKQGNFNAGSQEILVTFQKVLDPSSVVRESEYARSPQGQAFLKRLEGIPQRITKGGPGVTIEELESFVKAAEDMAGAVKGASAAKRKQLERTAQSFELDPSLLFDDDEENMPPETPSALGGGAPKVGDVKTFPNGRRAVFDGQGWAAQ